MLRRFVVLILVGLLLALRVPAAGGPTAQMFNGQVISMETAGLSLKERAAAACRQWATGKDGSSFFTAWAFPVSERITSCRGRHAASDDGPLTIRSKNGRIIVNADRDHSLNISDGPGTEREGAYRGVLLFLNRMEGGRCRVSDVQLLAPERTYDLNGERLAWLGEADEAQGLGCIRGLLAPDSVPDVRKHLVLALYLFNGSAAVSDLIALARLDPDAEIRKQAIFWLGQKASSAAVKALGDVIASPETLEIKKHAVFALSQLPEEKGTPMLLDIARRNPYPRLRKEAIFWLGESGDPRALDFFEEILLK